MVLIVASTSAVSLYTHYMRHHTPMERYYCKILSSSCEMNAYIGRRHSIISISGDNRKLYRLLAASAVVETANSAALSDYGVNAAGIAEIVIFRNDSSLAEMPGSFA